MFQYNKDFSYEEKLSEGLIMTSEHTKEEYKQICEKLLKHNYENTNGLLNKPGIDIYLLLKENDKIIGAISCDTFNMCMYIDVLWLDKEYRGLGYGKKLISQAEKIAKENGCIFSHTCTYNYQSPDFYKACGYEIFGEISDYPNGIIQYFLKKKL